MTCTRELTMFGQSCVAGSLIGEFLVVISVIYSQASLTQCYSFVLKVVKGKVVNERNSDFLQCQVPTCMRMIRKRFTETKLCARI